MCCRQLGSYKQKVANKRFPEGSITEKYLTEEAITYCRLYIGVEEDDEEADVTHDAAHHDLSVVSDLVRPQNEYCRRRLSGDEIAEAHWQVLIDCDEVTPYMNVHETEYMRTYPNQQEQARRNNFHPFFLDWVSITYLLQLLDDPCP